MALSPMMQQYLKLKQDNEDTILFFRLGDFYEMFFSDAELVSKELDLTLTGRDCGQNEKAPMCGVPYHSSEAYIARLVEKGYKVAICEQMEDPSEARGLVKRDIVRVITPGTVIEGSMLDETKNNFICDICAGEQFTGVSFCDISTGELYSTRIQFDKIKDELARFNPREILFLGDINKIRSLSSFIKDKLSASVEVLNTEDFDILKCKNIVESQFKKEVIDNIGFDDKLEILISVASLMSYLKDTQKKGLERINSIEIYNDSQFMRLDINTRRNLELLQTMRNNEKKGSLLWVLDKTKTAMGKRLIRSWIEQPLVNFTKITKRQNAIEELNGDIILRSNIIEELSSVHDVERLLTKIVYGSANARDLRSLYSTIEKTKKIKNHLKTVKSSLLTEIYDMIDNLDDIKSLIENSIVDDPPFSVREGGFIKKGFNNEIDILQNDMHSGKDFIASMEAREKKKTGISKLKIGYNKVFGYYIEVTNSYKDKVPSDYIRKQTLSSCERYITQELKEIEGRVLGAKDKVIKLEYDVFCEILKKVSDELVRIQNTARAIAKLDVLCSLSYVSTTNNYSRPNININGKLNIKDGRHPVVEKLLDAPFVPNDTILDKDENRVAIITGPNMAGKSTYMRQTALIVLMAQIGCFVPASSADISIVDSIFTRVGASDDLASGQSTFMVEMTEVANIIKNATSDSLLILDEIGRGTSTFDGMSIARAVLEYVADKKSIGAKTLFATHYHELTDMESCLDGVKNYNIAVKKRGDDITFLRRIVRGSADDSYGIEVAKLSGIPESIIKRAKQILNDLESSQNSDKIVLEKNNRNHDIVDNGQMSLIDSNYNNVIEKLESIDINTLTPIESMNILFEIKKLLSK